MTRLSQGKGLTVTCAWDLGEACHLGLCLLHAIIAKGWHSSPPNTLTHAPSSNIAFRRLARSTTVELNSSAFSTLRRAIRSGVRKHTLLRLQAVRFPLTSCHQQNRPSRPTFVIDHNFASTGTQLHAFVWRSDGSGPRYLVCASLGFSSPDILETRIFPERARCCTHRSPTAECRTFPNPSRRTVPIDAFASDLIATWPHKQMSFKVDCSPMPAVAALKTAANSGSPLLRAKTPVVLDHAFTN